jgi:hypothetical protein
MNTLTLLQNNYIPREYSRGDGVPEVVECSMRRLFCDSSSKPWFSQVTLKEGWSCHLMAFTGNTEALVDVVSIPLFPLLLSAVSSRLVTVKISRIMRSG